MSNVISIQARIIERTAVEYGRAARVDDLEKIKRLKSQVDRMLAKPLEESNRLAYAGLERVIHARLIKSAPKKPVRAKRTLVQF